MNLYLRATQLEKFRRFISDNYDYETETSLMETLTGVFTGNEYTRIGNAFHQLVELGDIRQSKADVFGIESGPKYVDFEGFRVLFSESHVSTALGYKSELKGCFHEIRTTKEYQIGDSKVIVSGCADVILGNTIRDIKTRYSPSRSIHDYIDSVQWKLYLDIFELSEFYFDVFEFQGYDISKNGYDVSGLNLKRHDPIQCIQYSGMDNDIYYLLAEFAGYIKNRNLEQYFQSLKK